MISRSMNQSEIMKAIAKHAVYLWPELKRRPTVDVSFDVNKKNKVVATINSVEAKKEQL